MNFLAASSARADQLYYLTSPFGQMGTQNKRNSTPCCMMLLVLLTSLKKLNGIRDKRRTWDLYEQNPRSVKCSQPHALAASAGLQPDTAWGSPRRDHPAFRAVLSQEPAALCDLGAGGRSVSTRLLPRETPQVEERHGSHTDPCCFPPSPHKGLVLRHRVWGAPRPARSQLCV